LGNADIIFYGERGVVNGIILDIKDDSKLGEKSTSPRNGTGYHPTFVEYSAEQYELAKSTTWSH
jgi:hypothetical protein